MLQCGDPRNDNERNGRECNDSIEVALDHECTLILGRGRRSPVGGRHALRKSFADGFRRCSAPPGFHVYSLDGQKQNMVNQSFNICPDCVEKRVHVWFAFMCGT